ncbi:MAG: nickel-responsive transcriptional regulator NikR [Methanoregula sp.]|nr:MAG: nickel-responsive transcriptional regulator NikR [Methanoregula sp.]
MTIDQDLSRTGISIPTHLLEKFDEIINQRGYSSRSEGIRDAIRTYITNYTWMSEVKGDRHGVITMVYEHDHRGLLQTINNIQHEFRSIIKTALHAHMSHDRCLEVVLVRGEGPQIKSLAERFMSLKGVESVKLTTIQVED